MGDNSHFSFYIGFVCLLAVALGLTCGATFCRGPRRQPRLVFRLATLRKEGVGAAPEMFDVWVPALGEDGDVDAPGHGENTVEMGKERALRRWRGMKPIAFTAFNYKALAASEGEDAPSLSALPSGSSTTGHPAGALPTALLADPSPPPPALAPPSANAHIPLPARPPPPWGHRAVARLRSLIFLPGSAEDPQALADGGAARPFSPQAIADAGVPTQVQVSVLIAMPSRRPSWISAGDAKAVEGGAGHGDGLGLGLGEQALGPYMLGVADLPWGASNRKSDSEAT